MKYQIVIKDLEEGKEVVNTETNALFSVIVDKDNTRVVFATECNKMDMVRLLTHIKKGYKDALKSVPPDILALLAMAEALIIKK